MKNPATNCRTSSDSYLNVQSLYNGRDVCSSVPKSNDPLSVVSDSVQLCGQNYVLAIVSNKHFNCLSSLDYTDRIQLYYHVYGCESLALIFYVVHGTSSQNRTLRIPTKYTTVIFHTHMYLACTFVTHMYNAYFMVQYFQSLLYISSHK